MDTAFRHDWAIFFFMIFLKLFKVIWKDKSFFSIFKELVLSQGISTHDF